MPNQTNRLQLQLPLGTDGVPELRQAITNIASVLDNSVTVTSGPLASIPAPGLPGRRYFATDVGIELWDTGSSWIPTGPALPVGAMAMWSINADPVDPDGTTRWMVADGRSLTKTSYPALNTLYNTAGYPWGSTSTTLALPDTRGRLVVGPDAGIGQGAAGRLTTAAGHQNTLAGSGGEERHTLVEGELASHNHGGETQYTNTDHYHSFSGQTGGQSADHSHLTDVPVGATSLVNLWTTNGNWDAPGTTPTNWGSGGSSNDHSHGYSGNTTFQSQTYATNNHQHVINSDGSNTPHNTLGPYLVVHHIIRVQ